jgi:integrase
MPDPQRRGQRAGVENLWFDTAGNPTQRNGRGKQWRVTVVDSAGRRSTMSFDRKVDATAWRDEQLSKLTVGTFVTPAAGLLTVGQVHEQWLRQQGHNASSTHALRESTWRTWVSERWADVAVRDVHRSDVKAWVAEMAEDGEAGAATIENAVSVLRQVLAVAVDDRRIAVNPCTGISTPPREHRPRAYLTHEQVWQLADATDVRYRTLILFLAYTGLRFGEAAAMEVRDLNLLLRRAEVRQQVTEVSGKLEWTPTKGKRRRSVPLPKFLIAPLSRECEGKKRTDPVFTAPKGGTLRLNSWRSRTWNTAIDTLRGLDDEGVAHTDYPYATPHDLRHTAASLAISAGANVLAVQTMLGHESATLTLDTYADLFPSDLDSVAAAFDEAAAKLGLGATGGETPTAASD